MMPAASSSCRAGEVYEDRATIREAGWVIGVPAWAEVAVIVDGELVISKTVADYEGHLFLKQSWFDEYGDGEIDVYIRKTYEERKKEEES